ncbi:MAG: DUF6261 family protein [Paludibacter sp.]
MKITLSRISVSGLTFMCEEIIRYSETTANVLMGNHPLLDVLKTEFGKYYAVFGKKAYSGKGKQVAEANTNRTDMYLAARLVLRGYSKAKGFGGQTDAQQLLALFRLKGKKVFQESYLSKSADMTHLARQLQLPENKERAERLHFIEIMELLITAINHFETQYNDQIGANAELHSQPSATSMRKELESVLGNYLNLIKAMKSVNEDWGKFYLYVQEVAKSVKASPQNKKNKNPNQDKTE